MPELICPECRAEISEDDFNISTDIAYCRNCNTNHEYSGLMRMGDLDDVELSDPPKGIRIVPSYRGEVLQYKKMSSILLFMIVFETFWTVILSVILIAPGEGGEGPPFLFLLPFFGVSAGMFIAIMFMLLSKRTVEVGDYETVIKYGVGGFSFKKQFNNDDFQSVGLQKGSYSVNNVVQDEVCVVLNDSTEIRFGAMMKDASKKYIAAYIKSKLT